MNRRTAEILVVTVVLLLFSFGVFFRERSWNFHSVRQNEQLVLISNQLDSALLLLRIQDSSSFQCDADVLNGNLNQSMISTQMTHALTRRSFDVDSLFLFSKNIIPSPTRYLLNFTGIVLIALFTFIKLFEIYFGHVGVFHEEKCGMSHDGNVLFTDFIRRWTPVSSVVLFQVILVVAIVAWLGVLSAGPVVVLSLQAVWCWLWASWISHVCCNAIRLRKYLPTSREHWIKEMKTSAWWLWVFPRLIGVDSLELAIVLAVRVVVLVWLLWPFRYFYFYKESFTAGSHVTDIFLLNMLVHSSFLMVFLGSSSMRLFGSPQWLKTSDWVRYAFPLANCTPRFFTQVVVGALVSVVVCALRCLWFAFYGGGGWWGACMTWMFLHSQIICPMVNLAILSSSVTRDRLLLDREGFVGGFVSNLQQRILALRRHQGDDAQSVSVKTTANITSLANSLFDAFVDRTMRNYALGAGEVNYQNFDSRQKEKKEKEANTIAVEDTSLEDLRSAFDEVNTEFMVAHECLDEVVREVLRSRGLSDEQVLAAIELGSESQEHEDLDGIAFLPPGVQDLDTMKEVLSRLLGARVV